MNNTEVWVYEPKEYTCPASLLRPLLLLIGADKDGMNGPEQARTHAKHASPLRTENYAFSFLPFLYSSLLFRSAFSLSLYYLSFHTLLCHSF